MTPPLERSPQIHASRSASPTPDYLRPRGLGAPTTLVVIGITIAFALVPAGFGERAQAHPIAALTVLGSIVALLLRGRLPQLATALALIAAAIGIETGGPTFAFLPSVLLTLFTLATATDRITTVVAVILASSIAGEVATGVLPRFYSDTRIVLLWVVLTVLAAMTGDAARSRAAYIESINERARRAEANLESEAQRRVIEERLRLARDLHDAVAHHIAVINLQASAARRALPAEAKASAKSLDAVTDSARTVLTDMGNLLYVLRQGEAGTGENAPVAGLAELPGLLEIYAADGLRVDYVVDGEGTDGGDPIGGVTATLDQPVDIVAYRTIQEGLTNAHKHGSGGTASLQLTFDAENLTATIVNPTRPLAAGPGSSDYPDHRSYGLAGVRERVASVGGTFDAGPTPGGTFTFTVTLPLVIPDANRSIS
jgi:signal transduction histidine kinase